MRSLRTHAAREAVLVLMLALLASCGGRGKAASTAAHLATTTHEALNASRDVFVAWDAQHQLDLVEQATSLEDGQALLAAYRAKRQVVYAVFQGAYGSVAAVAVLVPLVEAGKATTVELIGVVAELAQALTAMREATSTLMGHR
jgi:hypothetical protein